MLLALTQSGSPGADATRLTATRLTITAFDRQNSSGCSGTAQNYTLKSEQETHAEAELLFSRKMVAAVSG